MVSSADQAVGYVAIKDFAPRLDDELALSKGDSVELLADDAEFGDGWYMGRNLATGQVGLYPKIFTARQETSTGGASAPSLLRSRSRRTPAQSVASETAAPKDVQGYVTDIDNALKELDVGGNNGAGASANTSSVLDPSEVSQWTPVQVSQYMAHQGVDSDSCARFVQHKISGSILCELELAHLKELDIDSFGTRYEIFKIIEKLRTGGSNITPVVQQQSNLNRNSQMYTPKQQYFNDSSSEINRTPTVMYNHNNNSQQQHHHQIEQTPTQLNDHPNESSTPELKIDSTQFLSPRRAPQPPSYPSPVAENPMRFGLNSPEKTDRVRHSLLVPQLNVLGHSRQSSASSIYMESEQDPLLEEDEHLPQLKPVQQQSPEPLESPTTSQSIAKRMSAILHGGSTSDLNSPTESYISMGERRTVSAKEFKASSQERIESKRIQSTNTVIYEQLTHNNSSNGPNPVGSSNENSSSTLSTFKSLAQRKPLPKTQTSAFQEGIQEISVQDSIATSSYSGWMYKRGNSTIGSWKQRFFTLHKTRLSYFTSLKDTKERGLIDITGHRVLPANDTEDKLNAMYAASAGYGRYMFKIVPPAPGARMGLTFTQQKVHYFAVETKEEMRHWMGALMKSTIEVDETVPVISSCVTPTIPLQRAQELMAIAREKGQENLEKLQRERQQETERAGSMTLSEAIQANSNMTFDSKSNLPRTAAVNGLASVVNGNGSSGNITPRQASMKAGAPPIITRLDSASASADDSLGSASATNSPADFEQPSPHPGMSRTNSFRRVISLRRNRD